MLQDRKTKVINSACANLTRDYLHSCRPCRGSAIFRFFKWGALPLYKSAVKIRNYLQFSANWHPNQNIGNFRAKSPNSATHPVWRHYCSLWNEIYTLYPSYSLGGRCLSCVTCVFPKHIHKGIWDLCTTWCILQSLSILEHACWCRSQSYETSKVYVSVTQYNKRDILSARFILR